MRRIVQHVHSKNSKEEGLAWLAARGSWLRPRPPARGRLATANPPCRGGWLQPRPPCKGSAGHLQGAVTSRGNNPQGKVAGSQPARGCLRRTHKGLPPVRAAAPVVGVAAPWQGGCRPQRYHLCRGSGDGDGARG
ncbi:hypothetical protein BHM03_00053475 [Ensete ventricosum]|nr:hypothetical protein BHM03_00053475 [Ensete ventricosum]